VVDLIKSDEIDLIVNTSLGRSSFYDERAIRRAAMQYNVVTFTTLTGANAAASAIAAMRQEGQQESRLNVISLQEHHA
jgi:carbamoyl-phosphate synthase large subunit